MKDVVMHNSPLESHEISRHLPSERKSVLSAAAEEITFKAGETVFLRGEKADDFFVDWKGKCHGSWRSDCTD